MFGGASCIELFGLQGQGYLYLFDGASCIELFDLEGQGYLICLAVLRESTCLAFKVKATAICLHDSVS